MNENVPRLQVFHHLCQKPVKSGRLHRAVDLAPPDLFFAFGIFDDEFVFGRASGPFAGGDHEGPADRELAFRLLQRLFNECIDRKIPMDLAANIPVKNIFFHKVDDPPCVLYTVCTCQEIRKISNIFFGDGSIL